jgi:hypothetical protein
MKLMSNGKVRRTADEWREILTQWKKSGLRPTEFCRKHELQLSSFQRWQQKLNESSRSDDFVTVATAPLPTSSWALEITLPNGCKLHFQG